MSEHVEVEQISRIWIDQHAIEVGEHADNPGYGEIRVTGIKNIEYFGALNLSLTPEAMRALGQALVRHADVLEQR